MSVVYCVDTSTLIDLSRLYPQRTFPSLWRELEGLVRKGRSIAPRQVLREIEQGDDLLLRWARKIRRMFRQLDSEQLAVVGEVIQRFPALVDAQKETEDADPFVIAMAVVFDRRKKGSLFEQEECVVLAQEKAKPGAVNIPSVCAHYGVRVVRHLDFFAMEGWRF